MSIDEILESWKGTPYMPGQSCKRGGVDCVRFVFAVLDEALGLPRTRVRTLPPDVCAHAPELAEEHVERLRAHYETEEIALEEVRAGDVVVTGPIKGGPGHVLIADSRGRLWHATHPMVHATTMRGVRLYGHSPRRAFRVRGL